MTELSKNAILYMPENDERPIGIVQIIHDMGEYQGRYRSLAQFLSNHGFAVITSDLQGHGNNLARISELGFFGDNAISRLIGDIHENTRYIRNHFPDIPYLMVGHGMGALIATIYFKRYDNFLNGLFLSGMPSDRRSRIVMNTLIRLYIAVRGEYFRSKIIDSLMIGPYYKPFAKEGSASAWLSSDPEVVESYDSDPKCGFIYTLNGFCTLTEIMDAAYTSGSWIRKNLDCPVRVLCGSEDPCLINHSSFLKSVHLFTEHGYRNVAYTTYPGQRHDVFQDTERDMVFDDLLQEMELICSGVLQAAPEEEEKGPVHIVLEDFIDPEVEQPFKDPEQKIDLEKYINAHKAAHPDDAEAKVSKVEMVDFINIEAFIDPHHAAFTEPEFSEIKSPNPRTDLSYIENEEEKIP